MNTLANYPTQPRAIKRLKRALSSRRIAHAYLFCGTAQADTYGVGLALAAALNCSEDPLGCGKCISCRKIADGIHPDVITLQTEGTAQVIPIATIRNQVSARLGGRPNEGKARIFLIREATTLLGPAANALLKTLEEPPEDTHFVLATRAPEQLLPTIRSRCQQFVFASSTSGEEEPQDGDEQTKQQIADAIASLHLAMTTETLASRLQAAQEVGSDRSIALAALRAYGRQIREQALTAFQDGDRARAVKLAKAGHVLLTAETPLTEHNCHPQLTIEGLLQTAQPVSPHPSRYGTAPRVRS